MTHSITNTIAAIAIILLGILLAGSIGLLTMTSLTSLTTKTSTEFEQMRTNSIAYDAAFSASDATTTAA